MEVVEYQFKPNEAWFHKNIYLEIRPYLISHEIIPLNSLETGLKSWDFKGRVLRDGLWPKIFTVQLLEIHSIPWTSLAIACLKLGAWFVPLQLRTIYTQHSTNPNLTRLPSAWWLAVEGWMWLEWLWEVGRSPTGYKLAYSRLQF
jgi:hypothetical protein